MSKVLRTKFGHKKEQVTGSWKELRIEELHDLYHYRILLVLLNQGG
jgi:hypothetical protein